MRFLLIFVLGAVCGTVLHVEFRPCYGILVDEQEPLAVREGPGGSEVFSLYDYARYETWESSVVDGAIVSRFVGVDCPACGQDVGVMEHGSLRYCDCGRKLKTYGNALYVYPVTPMTK